MCVFGARAVITVERGYYAAKYLAEELETTVDPTAFTGFTRCAAAC